MNKLKSRTKELIRKFALKLWRTFFESDSLANPLRAYPKSPAALKVIHEHAK